MCYTIFTKKKCTLFTGMICVNRVFFCVLFFKFRFSETVNFSNICKDKIKDWRQRTRYCFNYLLFLCFGFGTQEYYTLLCYLRRNSLKPEACVLFQTRSTIVRLFLVMLHNWETCVSVCTDNMNNYKLFLS